METGATYDARETLIGRCSRILFLFRPEQPVLASDGGLFSLLLCFFLPLFWGGHFLLLQRRYTSITPCAWVDVLSSRLETLSPLDSED